MKSKDGIRTGEFGIWLTRHLTGYSQYSVYYDHGNKQEEPNVGEIKGFYGHKVAAKNILTNIDVMVVSKNNDEAILLIEIEEGKMSPKKLLGDVFAALMSNRFAVRIENEHKYFGLSTRTRLIVAGVVPNKGDAQDKIINTITPRLRQFNVPDDSIQIDKIKFVFGNDVSETLEELKNEMKKFFVLD